jgi:DNA polymerase-1
MKVAMLAIHDDLRKLGLRARMTMQVHDELVFEVPQDEIEVWPSWWSVTCAKLPCNRWN